MKNKTIILIVSFFILFFLLTILTLSFLISDRRYSNHSQLSTLRTDVPCSEINLVSDMSDSEIFIPIKRIEWNPGNQFSPIKETIPNLILRCGEVTEKNEQIVRFQFGFGIIASEDFQKYSYSISFYNKLNNQMFTKVFSDINGVDEFRKWEIVPISLSFENSEGFSEIPEYIYVSEGIPVVNRMASNFSSLDPISSNLSEEFSYIQGSVGHSSEPNSNFTIHQRGIWKGVKLGTGGGRNSFTSITTYLIGISFEIKNETSKELVNSEIVFHFLDVNGREIISLDKALWKDFQKISIASKSKFGMDSNFIFDKEIYEKISSIKISLKSYNLN